MMIRSSTWRNWILALLMLCFIGVQIIESSHDHLSQAAQNACPVCQLVAHQPLNTPPAVTLALAVVISLLIILPYRRRTFRLAESRHITYFSRAPPEHLA